MRRSLATLVAALLVLAGLSAAAAVSAPAGAQVYPTRVFADCVHRRYEPPQIVIACGDGGAVAIRLDYSYWTVAAATGAGVMRIRICKPSCSQGYFKGFPMRFTLGRVRGVGTRRVFTRLYATYTRAEPNGHRHETYPLPARPY